MERRRRAPLTREEALALQDDLIVKFSKPDFQQKLEAVLHAAGDDIVSQIRARHKLCVPIQLPVVRKYGFGDVAHSISAFTDDLNADPEIAEKRSKLATLVNPSLRTTMKDMVNPFKQIILRSVPGRHWTVVGGEHMGGIIARRGKELTSPLLGSREGPILLATGAEVEEIELLGERLHYRKLNVEDVGPEFGWVSIWSSSLKTLLEPTNQEEPVLMLKG